MDKDEALRIALEALVDFGWHIENCPQFPTWAEPKKHPPCTCGYDTAITALRQALEQPEQPYKEFANRMYRETNGRMRIDPVTGDVGIGSPSEQPEQEPVACKHNRYSVDVHEQTGTCYDCGAEGRMRFVVDDTAPPKREWVGLTDEEIDYIWGVTKPDYEDLFDFPRAIESKLKEKNT